MHSITKIIEKLNQAAILHVTKARLISVGINDCNLPSLYNRNFSVPENTFHAGK